MRVAGDVRMNDHERYIVLVSSNAHVAFRSALERLVAERPEVVVETVDGGVPRESSVLDELPRMVVELKPEPPMPNLKCMGPLRERPYHDDSPRSPVRRFKKGSKR